MKVAELLAAEDPGLALRIGATPGGCSGLRYQLFFDDQNYPGDVVTTFGDVRVVTDQLSASFLAGAVIDFTDTAAQTGFTIDNPYTTGSCGCGDSGMADEADGCGCGGGGHQGCGCGGGGGGHQGCGCGGGGCC